MVVKNQKAFTLNHLKLVLRLGLFVWAIVLYVTTKEFVQSNTLFLALAGGLFLVEMIMKLFPLGYESMGSQKQFARNFAPVKDKIKVKVADKKKLIIIIALLWVVLNGFIAHMYLKNVIDTGVMVLISLFYSVCDMICVLFYCPFQSIMGNKCCSTCRIHNWDYVMMATPLVFIDNVFAKVLFCVSAVIFIRWEYTAWRHPERFYEETNTSLKCASCKETRCSRKNCKIKRS